MSEIYILHFDRPLWGHAQHYCGYAKFTAQERLQKHQAGIGSRFCSHANRCGISYEIVHVEQFETSKEARRREIQLKKESNLRKYCNICRKEILNETNNDSQGRMAVGQGTLHP